MEIAENVTKSNEKKKNNDLKTKTINNKTCPEIGNTKIQYKIFKILNNFHRENHNN